MLQRQDTRTQKQLLKYGWNEDFRTDDNGRLIIGDELSNIFALKKGATEKDIARDFAIALKNAPQAFLALLGEQSGVKFEDAVRGVVNLKIGNNVFDGKNGLRDLVQWISKTIGDETTFNQDNNTFFLDEHRKFSDFLINFDSMIKRLSRSVGSKENEDDHTAVI